MCKTVIFIPNAEPATLHADCVSCGREWPIDALHGIQNQDDAARVAGLLEVDPDGDLCPECREALVAEAKDTRCPYCRRWACPGPVIQVDVDRWECPRL